MVPERGHDEDAEDAEERAAQNAVSELEGSTERVTQSISLSFGTAVDEDEIDESDVVADDDVRVLGSEAEDLGIAEDAADSEEPGAEEADVDDPSGESGSGEGAEEAAPETDTEVDDPSWQDDAEASANGGGPTPAETSQAESQSTPRPRGDDQQSAPASVAPGLEDHDFNRAHEEYGAGEPPNDAGSGAPQHVPRGYLGGESDVGGGESVRVRPGVSADAEPSYSLTADRLLSHKRSGRPAPQGGMRHALYRVSGGRLNLGDSKRVRRERDRTDRIAKHFAGSARFVPILSRKGGVGKTTVSMLLGMALADAREDRVIALDANPDRGSLGDRVSDPSDFCIRDVLRRHENIEGYTEFSSLVARDATRLDVLAGDNDTTAARTFGADDYSTVADLASQYYSMVLTDTGPGIVHGVMSRTLERADSLVVVSGFSVDEARVASDTLSWLDANGYADLAANAVVVLNARSSSSTMVDRAELERHFLSRVRSVVTIPYDPLLAAGSAVAYDRVKPATRKAARELAARLVDGLPTQRPQVLERAQQ